MEIDKGHIVWLKSGGPAMTANVKSTSATGAEGWYCTWFEGAIKHESLFGIEQLTDKKPNT